MAKKLETADATSRALDDILYPDLRLNLQQKLVQLKLLTKLIHQRLNQNNDMGINPRDRRGINPNNLYILRGPQL